MPVAQNAIEIQNADARGAKVSNREARNTLT
jgi:hypothetical protein